MNKEYFFKILIMALIYFVAGKMSIAIINNHYIVTMGIFAAEGFSMAAVLIFGRSIWPGVFIGQFLLSLSEGVPFLPSFGISAINSMEIIIIWHMFHAFHLNRSLDTIRDVLGLFFIIIFIAQPFSAFFSTAILYFTSILNHMNYWFSLFSWWFGNSMGQLLWAPVLLLFYEHRKEITFFSTLFLITFFSLLVYTILFIAPIYSLPVIITITMPLTIYITIIRNVLIGNIVVVIMSVLSMYAAYKNIGIFSMHDMAENIINLNFFILSHILIVLTIGTLYHENMRTKNKLKELSESLEEKVVEQVEKLNKQNILIAQQARLASMGEMLGMIAHQWRQPLNRINSNIAVVSSISKEKTFDRTILQDKLQNIKNQTKFLSDTVEDFSNFFHPDKKKQEFMPQVILERALMLIDIHSKDIIVDIEAQKDIWLYSYENEYLQVLLTILHNAIDNFDARSVHNPKLEITLQTLGTEVSLTIQDNGGGIMQKDIDTIFDPFFTTNCTDRNSGLGLYMANILVEDSMNGHITVTNKKNGACFTLTVPQGEKNV